MHFFLMLIAIFVQFFKVANGDVLTLEISSSGRLVEKVEWNDTEKGFNIKFHPSGFEGAKLYHLKFIPGTSGDPGPGIADENDAVSTAARHDRFDPAKAAAMVSAQV